MPLLGIFLLVVGVISLLYYGVIISYAGLQSAFSWFWLLLGIGCIVLFFAVRFMIQHEIVLGKWLRTMIVSFVTIGLCIFILIEGILIFNANQRADKGMDYLIVLGAQVKGTTVSKTLRKRLDTAAEYLQDNPKTIAIVSGGQGPGEDITEAEAMKRYLMGKGIDEKRLLKEDKSVNTNENIRFSKAMIKNDQAAVAVVTNGFHVFRAVNIAKKQGFTNIQGLSAPTDPILFANYYVREVLGVIKDKVVGNL